MRTASQSKNIKGRYHLEELRVDGRITLTLIIKKHDVYWIHGV
jgi:hypothetical protein